MPHGEFYWTIVSLWVVVLTSLLVSALYVIRVLRTPRDPMKWALLALLSTLAMTNTPTLIGFVTHTPPPVLLGQTLRGISSLVLLWAVWPLIKDSMHEFKHYVCVLYTRSHPRAKVETRRRQVNRRSGKDRRKSP